MDDAIPTPEILAIRPDFGSHGNHEASEEKSRDSIAYFDLELQRAPACPSFSGVRVFRDFFTRREAESILREIEATPFVRAQSGKLKQHYGPKINFNKKKVNANQFQGVPAYALQIEDRLHKLVAAETVDCSATDRDAFERALQSFQTTDVFVLRYFEREASNLDFHLDDTFAYDELILDLSLESDSVMTFLDPRHTDENPGTPTCVRVPLPARSLAVQYGRARFEWEHGVLAYDIDGQRTSITSRALHHELRDTPEGRRIVVLAQGSEKAS